MRKNRSELQLPSWLGALVCCLLASTSIRAAQDDVSDPTSTIAASISSSDQQTVTTTYTDVPLMNIVEDDNNVVLDSTDSAMIMVNVSAEDSSQESGEVANTEKPAETLQPTRSTTRTGVYGKHSRSTNGWPWMVFVLRGNATVAGRRQRDLGVYLRLNLAARLDSDYNDVKVNRIVVSGQTVLANISVDPLHLTEGGTGAIGLEALAVGNVTLLELSGHEFQVDRIIRPEDVIDERGNSVIEVSSMMITSSTGVVVGLGTGSEVNVYGAVGAVFLFLLVALLLGLSFNSPCKSGSSHQHEQYLSNTINYLQGEEYCSAEMRSVMLSMMADNGVTSSGNSCPPVIYTEQLARDMGDSAGLLAPRSRFIPTDVSIVSCSLRLHQNENDQES